MAKYKLKLWEEGQLVEKAKFEKPGDMNNIFKDLKKKMGIK
jgi:mRNA-degrading endonuclease HigB of HigAB toxin-antitoxin module